MSGETLLHSKASKIIGAHGTGVSIVGLIDEWRNNVSGGKNPLVVGGIRTRVLADSMAIAANTLTVAPPRPL